MAGFPDVICYNGRIRTMSAEVPEAEALAIRGKRIVGVGTDKTLLAQAGPETRVIDLEGRRVIPGLVDAHNHAVKGAIAGLFSCKFAFTATPDDIAAALDLFVARFPNAPFIMGGRYGSDFFERFSEQIGASPRAWLDEKSHGRPVYLREDSGHNGWSNSAGLAMLGITKDTPDPKGGQIIRDASGEATGILLEEADVWARGKCPDWTAAQYREGVLEMLKIANGFGITGITDADANENILRAFKTVDDGDTKLTVHVAAGMTTPYGHREVPLDYELLDRWRDAYSSEHVDTRFVKIYEDGVALADSKSAAMLDPYMPDDRFPAGHCGSVHVSPEVLNQDVVELDKRGYTVKVHCCGDRAIRIVLDAVQKAREASGDSTLRHEIAHAGLISAQDLPRFKELNVVADLSPYLWYPSPIMLNAIKAIGNDRASRFYPIKDLLESGALLQAGSDCELCCGCI